MLDIVNAIFFAILIGTIVVLGATQWQTKPMSLKIFSVFGPLGLVALAFNHSHTTGWLVVYACLFMLGCYQVYLGFILAFFKGVTAGFLQMPSGIVVSALIVIGAVCVLGSFGAMVTIITPIASAFFGLAQ